MSPRNAHACAAFTCILWSFSYIIIVWLTRQIDANAVVLWRFNFLGLVAIPALLITRPPLARLTRKHWFIIFAIAITGGPAYYFPLTWAADAERTPASLIGLIIATTPVHASWMAALFLREHMTWRRALGLILGTSGIILILLDRYGLSSLTSTTILAPLAVQLSAILSAACAVMTRSFRNVMSPIQLFALTGTITVVFGLLMHPFVDMQSTFEILTPLGWLGLFFLGAVSIGLGYITWYSALGGLPVGSVALYLFLPSTLGAVWAYLWQNNELGLAYFAGSALVLLGLVIGTRSNSRSSQTPPPSESA